MSASDYTDANTAAELRYNSGDFPDVAPDEFEIQAKIKQLIDSKNPEVIDCIVADFPAVDQINELVLALAAANHLYDPRVIKALEPLFKTVKNGYREYVQ